MALRLSAKAVGFDRAKAELRGLPKAIRGRALRRGFSAIGRRVGRQLKSIIPGRSSKRTGATKKSIGFKVKLYRTSGNIVVTAGPRSGFKTTVTRRVVAQGRDTRGRFTEKKARRVEVKRRDGSVRYHNPTQVFHLVDRGTGSISARRYLRRALSMTRSQLPGILMTEVRKVVATWQRKQSTK